MSSVKEVKSPAGGACKGQPTELWFPKNTVGMKSAEILIQKNKINTALSICNSCKVKKECLEYSLQNEPFGIWGGKTEQERANIRYKNNIFLFKPEKVYTPAIGRPFFASESNIRRIAANRGMEVGSPNDI